MPHRRRNRDDRGATSVVLAILLPVLLGLVGLGSGVLVLVGAERELLRAASAGALAAASQMSLVNPAELNDVPPDPPVACEVPSPDPSDPQPPTCEVDPPPLPSPTQTVPTADPSGLPGTPEPPVTTPTIGADYRLASTWRPVGQIPSLPPTTPPPTSPPPLPSPPPTEVPTEVPTELPTEVETLLPTPLPTPSPPPTEPPVLPSANSPRAYACPVAAANLDAAVMTSAFGSRDGVAFAQPGGAVKYDNCDDDPGFPTGRSAQVRVHVTNDVFDRSIQEAQAVLDGLPAPFGGTVNLVNLLPNLLAPTVRLDIATLVRTPLARLVDPADAGQLVGAHAVARRVFKNAVVVPSTELICDVNPFLGYLGDELDLGEIPTAPTYDELVALLRDNGVVDPGPILPHCRFADSVNAALGEVGDDVLGYLQEVAALMAGLEEQLPPEIPRPPVTASCLVDAMRYELEAIYDPPDRGGPPAEQVATDIIEAAGNEDGNVLVVVAGVATAAATGSLIPILDAVPVAANQLNGADPFTALDFEGVYRATLLEESPLPTEGTLRGCDPRSAPIPNPCPEVLPSVPPTTLPTTPTVDPTATPTLPPTPTAPPSCPTPSPTVPDIPSPPFTPSPSPSINPSPSPSLPSPLPSPSPSPDPTSEPEPSLPPLPSLSPTPTAQGEAGG